MNHNIKALLLMGLAISLIATGLTLDVRNHNRNKAFQECIENEPTDAVCDSCWQAIYHEESPF